jgi:hypothetical protein
MYGFHTKFTVRCPAQDAQYQSMGQSALPARTRARLDGVNPNSLDRLRHPVDRAQPAKELAQLLL